MANVYNYLNSNYVWAICEDVLQRRSKTLNLSRRSMLEAPKLIEKCNFLLKLYLDNNKLKRLPAIENLTSLQILTLGDNQLQEFPIAVCDLPNLRYLNISCNDIAIIPPHIAKLELLEVLWCNNTGLISIAEEIGNCKCLETLGARGNRLEKLPSTIGLLKNLRWVTFESNHLRHIPKQFGALIRLVHFNVKDNLLKKMPRCLLYMNRLQYVYLSNNKIEKFLTEEELQNISYIKVMDISNNPICELVPRVVFEAHKNIICSKYFNAETISSDQSNESVAIENGVINNISDWEHSVRTSEIDSVDEDKTIIKFYFHRVYNFIHDKIQNLLQSITAIFIR